MKRGSRSQIVSPPNTTTSAPEIHSIGDTRPSLTLDTIIAANVASTNAAVAQITLAITSADIRSRSDKKPVVVAKAPPDGYAFGIGSAGARKLTAKNTSTGP